MEEEIKKYYDKIIEYFDEEEQHRSLRDVEKDLISKSLENIVNNNLDYLLKDSFLCFTINSIIGPSELYLCSRDEKMRRSIVVSYCTAALIDIKRDVWPKYICMLDDDFREACNIANSYIRELARSFMKYHYRIQDIFNVVYVVLAYCYMNNCLKSFPEYIKYFLDDPYQTLEDLYMNDIISRQGVRLGDEVDDLYDRIFNIIDSFKRTKIE